MKPERKYLNEEERQLLWKYGVKCPKKCGVNDLLAILPRKWMDGSWVNFSISTDEMGWHCNSPWVNYDGACGMVANPQAHGDTMLECLLDAVLRLAKHERDWLSNGCLANTGLYEDDLYRVTKRCAEKYA